VSRVGRNPVTIPSGVEVKLAGQSILAKSKLGERKIDVSNRVEVKLEDGKVVLAPREETKEARTLWGTTRSLLQSIVKGLQEAYRVDLEIVGVGYRAAVDKKTLNLQLGFSHDVKYPIPEGITIKCEKPTSISISGIDREKVGQVAAEIRAYRKPEPYKGKGIRYAGEQVREKEGKKK
jgi:large subunit ribosomal protein L6